MVVVIVTRKGQLDAVIECDDAKHAEKVFGQIADYFEVPFENHVVEGVVEDVNIKIEITQTMKLPQYINTNR